MNRPFTLIALVIAVLLALSPLSAAAAPANQVANSIVVPITGTVGDAGTFAGNFTIQTFRIVNGQLVAVGTLSGTLTDALGNVIGTVTNVPITVPVTAVGTCDILHLTLGPLDLNLLGLNVHLNQVVLDITATAAPGNLLGNLLCAVAGLLDKGGPLAGITALLNRILAIVGGL